ncbi:MAG: energy-coupling factor transporter transmembrane protein EcfT, partial [Candidatus Korarchaeota archaeon]|nr:energy-coupling factor transporter transmembrane protein EcfT [Candidatus Korarchaeota archaeon]NIU84927.1 hypothetical protein [Candidatus Thorarchaeota archaeon]NIW14944.1 hypothetical protein [Candidatus Thorarchaeota archaeon]NIW52911.1 hypothetical protein [Candidatus Korarchaeota archaeon]
MAQETLYIDKRSIFHGLDPRSKFTWTLCVWIWALAFNHPLWNLTIFLFVLAVGATAKILKDLSFIAYGLTSIFIMAVILWPFFVQGSTLLRKIGPFNIYYESVLYAFSIGFRIVSMVLAGMVFFTTTKVEDFAVALRKLRIPYSVIFGITMVFRFFPTMIGEASLISSAAKARGVDLKEGSLLEKARKRIAIMSPLIVTTLRRVIDLSKAIEARGFNAKKERTFLYTQTMKLKDWLLVVGSIILTMLL